MIWVALRMLTGDRVKYGGLVFGIVFTSFLVTFAASYFAGFMTEGFALIRENGDADVWVMDPAVGAVDQTSNMPSWALDRVRSVPGVRYAVPMVVGNADARFPNGRVQSLQIIGLDPATLAGLPPLQEGVVPQSLWAPGTAIIDPGGTDDKIGMPALARDRWPREGMNLDAPLRDPRPGDELRINDHRVVLAGLSRALPRYPPRPLLYMTADNALRLLPAERQRLTFVLAKAAAGLDPRELAGRIAARTGLRARSSADFKEDTVMWILENSEDVGDIASMLSVAMLIGFGVTGVMLYMFTHENLRHYAVLSAMGAPPRTLLGMVFAQAAVCAAIGAGMGVGLCAILGEAAAATGYPFRMMWFTPVFGIGMVVLVSLVAAAISARPVLKLQPAVVFSGR
jgi:putative ABC transport system permease protein